MHQTYFTLCYNYPHNATLSYPHKTRHPPRNDLQVGISKLVWVFALVVMFFFLSPTAAQAAITPGSPDNFITTWDTTKSGATANNQILIQGLGFGTSYNYDIYWENTASSSMNNSIIGTTTNNLLLTFPEPGIYRVEIAGTFPSLYTGADSKKILEVNQWGNIQWTSMFSAFEGASNLRIPATDAPDLSNVTNMSYMFKGASAFNDPINHWDVSNVIYMSWMFFTATNFNQPLDDWDVSSVESMDNLFHNAASFNQNINNWNVSSVTTMQNMFLLARSFDQPLNNWSLSFITNVADIFYGARLSTANQDATLALWTAQFFAKNFTNHYITKSIRRR